MTEKRFTLEQWTEESLYFSDGEFSAHMSIGYICKKVEKKLNEQQAINDYLEEANSRLQVQLGETLRLVDKLKEENKRLRKQVVEYELILRQHEFAEKEGFE